MRTLHPTGWPKPQSFSHGMIASGHPVFISGQVGITPQGAFKPDFASQVEQALRNVVAVLHEAGARPHHLTRLDWYVTDIADFHATAEQLFPVYAEVIGPHFPAMTMIQVGALVAPEAKVEIDAMAVVPAEAGASPEPNYYDREYDTAIAVPDIYAYVGRAAADAAAARAKLVCRLDVAYGDRPEETLDFFPAGRDGGPLLLFVHGGYWQALDKSQHSQLATALVGAGVNIAVINYPLLPTVTLYDVVASVRRAAAWLWRAAPDLGFDRRRLFAAGQSAGGHLSAMLLATPWAELSSDLPAAVVRGALCVNGLHDLEPLTKAPFIRDVLALSALDVPRLSPARLAPNPGVRFLTAVGGLEPYEFHWQSRLLAERWPEAFVADIAMPGRNHVDVIEDLMVPGSPMFEAVLRLMEPE